MVNGKKILNVVRVRFSSKVSNCFSYLMGVG